MNTIAASVAALLVIFALYGCDSYEPPITEADDTVAEPSGSLFSPASRTGMAKEYNDYNGANTEVGDYMVTLDIPNGTYFGDKLEVYRWTVEYTGRRRKDDKINHFAITLDECAEDGFFSNDEGFNSNSSTTFDVQWHPSEGQGGPYVFVGQYPAGQGRWIGYGTAEIKTSGNEKFEGTILLPCMNTTTIDASVFFDDNRSATQQLPIEPGIDGITVTLRDANNEGDAPADPDNEVVAIETSAGGGEILFEGVLPGSYTLDVPSSVSDLWLTTTIPTHEVVVAVESSTFAPVGLDKYDILGNIFAVDGEVDPVGLAGVNIEVWQGSSKKADAVSTGNGDYVLLNVFGNPSGYEPYQIRIPKGANSALYDAFIPLTGVETLADGSAVISGVRVGGTVDAGCGDGNSCSNDIGFEPNVFTISGRVTVDPRNSTTGTADELSYAGIPNVTVELIPEVLGGTCDPSCSISTDEFGAYVFSDVPAGEYVVSVPDATSLIEADFNEDLHIFYEHTGTDARPVEGGAQLEVTVGPDAEQVDFAWLAETGTYANAFANDPDYSIFSLGVTEWLHKFDAACRANDDANYVIQYKDRFKAVQGVSAQFLIDALNDFLYPNVPPDPFLSSCDVAEALSKPLAGGRNNVDPLTKLYWQLLAAELNFHTQYLGLVLNPSGSEDGPIPENMLRYMEDFIGRELFGPEAGAQGKRASSAYGGEESMLSSYNGGGGGGGGTGFE